MPRLILRSSSTSGQEPSTPVSLSSPVRLPCLPGEMETSTLFLTRSHDDRGLERSLGPHNLGTGGHILIPRPSVVFLRVDTATCHALSEKAGFYHPSTPISTVKAINSLSPCMGVRSCLCMFIRC